MPHGCCATLARAAWCVTPRVRATLGVPEAGGDGRTLLETLEDYLAGKKVLLLLDNFEHLLPAAPEVAQLLANCPRLKVLATSRQALHLRAEQLYAVPPMQLPAQGQRPEVIECCEAVRLFAQRAKAVQPSFALNERNVRLVAEICIRLDGLPLAIELAATHVRVLSPRAILTRLENRLRILRGGLQDLPERQQTLWNEIDWSHKLLDERERRVFRRMSLFPGGCTVDAAMAVCGVTGEDEEVLQSLTSLADKSLVRLGEGDVEPRFLMLDTIREYARERLEESGEVSTVEKGLAEYFLDFAERAEPFLYGPSQKQWFDRIEAEYDNIRAALAWMDAAGERGMGLRLAGALGWVWFRRARFTEGEHWLERFRSAEDVADTPGPRAKAVYFLGWMHLCVGRTFWGNPLRARGFSVRVSGSGGRRGTGGASPFRRCGWDGKKATSSTRKDGLPRMKASPARGRRVTPG